MPLSAAQKNIALCDKRFICVCAGRRFGKTHLAIRTLAQWARIPNKEVWYLAPTYRQAKMIAWKKLKRKLSDLNWIAKINESELTIQLKNDSTISLKGADSYDSLRGAGLDGLIIDEAAVIDPEAWFEVCRPTLSDKQGKALFITTPSGMNWFYDLFQNHKEDPDNWASFQYTTLDGNNVPREEVEQAQRDLDERTFRQEYMATFETYSGRIAWAFNRELNVCNAPPQLDTRTIIVGGDFNVSPICAVIMLRDGDMLYAVDEIQMYSSNTHELAEELKTRYPNSKIYFYPDPAGSARKTSSGGLTDHTILANAGFVVKSPRAHTPVKDRINALNSRLCSSDGLRHLFISPRCKYTIESLEKFCYKEGTQTPDKGQYDHMFDALSYAVDYLFPIKRELDPSLAQPQRFGHALSRTNL